MSEMEALGKKMGDVIYERIKPDLQEALNRAFESGKATGLQRGRDNGYAEAKAYSADRITALEGREAKLKATLVKAREAIGLISSQENLTFAECSIAEEIVHRAKEALRVLDEVLG